MKTHNLTLHITITESLHLLSKLNKLKLKFLISLKLVKLSIYLINDFRGVMLDIFVIL